ncbi:MAG: Asp23/Gls24 family envelope stress response protein [Coriobacteriales bacterium]|jgi:uncharacterized alkaline shock family protein YloU|nr:Asp23/Gls24 family envelope stress response protein [Coriobacteriales bacterium]
MSDSPEQGKVPIAGNLSITDAVITDLIGYAARESYGIVGMTAPTLQDGIAKLLPRRALSRGITVENSTEGISVNLHVVIEQGVNLSEVSRNLADRIRFVLTSYANLSVRDITVHVRGIHTSARFVQPSLAEPSGSSASQREG